MSNDSPVDSESRSSHAPDERRLGRMLLGNTGVSLERVGDYELGDVLGEGGMGEIYAGMHVETELLVAIKFPRADVLMSAAGTTLFRNEIDATSRLDHPNIVRVFPSTWDSERPYLVMELLDGGTLEDRDNRLRYGSANRALELVRTLAGALHHAHNKGVLHGDLKPSNVLFDAEHTPHITDFGLARVVQDIGVERTAALPGGTPGWQSPEQAAGEPGSVASDIFQLGVMLNWLVTGKLPEPVDGAPAERPWAPTLDCAVETITRRALALRPESRYRTAAELGDDLERALENLPLYDEAKRPFRRLVRWAHRRTLVAGMLVGAACMFAALPFFSNALFSDARAWIREQNRFAAGAQALAVRNQLEADAQNIARSALDENVVELTRWAELSREPPGLPQHMARFDNLFVFDALGEFGARSPVQTSLAYDHRSYAFRDYHRCATALATRVLSGSVGRSPVCVSRVIRSTVDRTLKFSLGVPLIQDGRFLGVLTGSIQASDRFGAVEMRCGPGRCMTALIGPRDRDDPKAPVPSALAVVAHPSLRPPLVNPTDPNDERRLDSATVSRICNTLRCSADLDDPFGAPEHAPVVIDGFVEPVTRTRSVAVFAPVARTGLIVMAATPDAAFEDIKATLKRRASLFVALPLALGMALFAGVLFLPTLRRRLTRARS